MHATRKAASARARYCSAALWLSLGAMVVLASPTAQAANNARYVSINGDNANDCTLAAPCRSLQRGINMTPAGGELPILDSGGYGIQADIGKSMTISGNGNTVYLARAISVDSPDAVVALRDLVLSGPSATGIAIGPAAAVHIERCIIHGFGANGILIYGDGVQVSIVDSVSRDNAYRGLAIDPCANANTNNGDDRQLSLHGQHAGRNPCGERPCYGRSLDSVQHGGSGITAGRHAVVSVVSTVALRNLRGFVAREGVITVESSIAQGNRLGVEVSDGGTARLSNSTVTAVANNDGVVETRRNNTVRDNTTNVNGTLTPIGGV